MRFFIGIKLDDTARESIDKFLKPFKKTGTPLKFTKTENLHLTLKFIGDVTDSQYSQMEKLLTSASYDAGTFNMNLTGCGKFGRGGELSIFWLGIEKNPAMESLYDTIEETLRRASVPRETRPFKPHITVARNKKRYNFKSFFTLLEENQDHPIAQIPVTHFQLFKSQLTPDGPIYSILKEVPLVAG